MVLEGKRKRGEDGGKGLEMKKVKEAKGYLLRQSCKLGQLDPIS